LDRILALKRLAFAENRSDGYLVFNNHNLVYFLGFPGAACLFVTSDGEETVYVYGVNYEQAKAQCPKSKVELVKGGENLLSKVASQAKTCGLKKLVVDSLGAEAYFAFAREFTHASMIDVDGSCVQSLRRVKDLAEIELMRKAGDITSLGMKAAYETIRPGIREYEVAAEIEYDMRSYGGGSTAFETIVASGEFSAFPHGGCSDRVICEGDLVVVDIGSTYRYYCSDMTRTLVAGKPSLKQQKIYAIVQQAQDNAFAAVKSGAKIADLDATSRRIIAEAGFGEYFVHRLGHGVGLEVHESPSLSGDSVEVLEVGNVVTVEPGLYLPGYGGVRIEDTVLVGVNGAEKLTYAPYCLEAE
jgi:Xaa-Pro aminopeptidase